MSIETTAESVKWCSNCGASAIPKHSCGPFVVRQANEEREPFSPRWVAVHEPSGFSFPEKASREEAAADARVGNAVLRFVLDDDLDADRGRSQAWGTVASTLSRVLPKWYEIAETGERSAACAIERLADEATRAREADALRARVKSLEDALAMTVRPMERCGLVATADQIKAVLFAARSET